MSGEDHAVRTPVWRESRGRRLAASLAYPLIHLVNRPSAAWFGRALYDLALRCNGIAIGFEGRHHLSIAEENFLRRIRPEIEGGVVLDVGANHGAYARMVRRVAPTATVHAFEPHPGTFAKLAERDAGTDICLVNAAMGDREGTLELYDFAADDGSTQASLSRDSVRFFAADIVSHKVRCTTLDSYLEAEGIARVDLLKIDTEGFDLAVLRGARRAIAEKRLRLIQFEFIPANIANHVTMRDFFEALPGYEIYRLCLNGSLLPLFPYDVKRCEIYITHNLIARPA